VLLKIHNLYTATICVLATLSSRTLRPPNLVLHTWPLMTKRLDHSFYRTFNGIRGERSEIRRYDLPQLIDLERFVIRENCHNAKLSRLNYFRVGIDLSYLRMAYGPSLQCGQLTLACISLWNRFTAFCREGSC
jgi:hypothetical protein